MMEINSNQSSLVTILFMVFLTTSCSTVDVKTTEVVAVNQIIEDMPENELLDVGITIFENGLENIDQLDEDELVFPEIRVAEASFFPYLLMEAIQSSSAWGAVRVIPLGHDSVDVIITGKIVKSDGELMVLKIDVTDVSGMRWFDKEYTQRASKYSYNKNAQRHHDPFQNIYNRIANDLNAYRQQLTSAEKIALRQVSEVKFAKSFAPQQFSQHLSKTSSGYLTVNRLPAENDPMIVRIRQVRERVHLFIDTLQEYYGGYVKEMKEPYSQWRQESYSEVMAMRSMKTKASNQKLIGAVAIVAGILGAGNSGGSVRAASAIGMTAGVYLLKAGYDREAEAQIHIDALQELGDSLEASIESNVIELEDRTITLTGTVENQYQQWRNILKDIYQLDVSSSDDRD
ncbi:MAG: hypothetical protein HRT53_17080 [Colwellia sp.]|nr:hypothetical protein [Colwellia sp.]